MDFDHEFYGAYIENRVPYIRYGPFDLLTFIMNCLFVVMLLFSFFCALNYIAAAAEDFPTRTKRIIRGLVLVALVVHFVLMVECFSFWRSILSLVTNVLYLRILQTFPFVSLTTPLTIATVVASVLETVSWYSLFAFDAHFSGTVSAAKILGFLNFLWMAPIGLIASLEFEPIKLPGSQLGVSGVGKSEICADGEKKTIFKELKNWILLPLFP